MHPSSDNLPADQNARSCDSQAFYADVADGLHAMAQPLTVLRSAVEMLCFPGAVVNRDHYLRLSAEHLERTCSLFSALQSLVVARVLQAKRTRLDFWEIVAPVLQDHDLAMRPAGIGLAVAPRCGADLFCGDAERTEQAFAGILSATASLASRGDVIEISTAETKGFVSVTIQNSRGHKRRIDSSQRLSLSLARANILSQQGRFELMEDPIRTTLSLPIEDLGPIDTELNRFGPETN